MFGKLDRKMKSSTKSESLHNYVLNYLIPLMQNCLRVCIAVQEFRSHPYGRILFRYIYKHVSGSELIMVIKNGHAVFYFIYLSDYMRFE